jgi:23S rRNA (cytosine1962-C5)-methyltransferase
MGNSIENGRVVVRKRGADRIRRGHLWIYRSDVADAGKVPPGTIVKVRDERGNFVGKAFYSSKSQIALRFLTRFDLPINEEFFRKRFVDADRLRERAGIDPILSRRIYSEGDLLPGLIVDRYHDRFVVQSLIQSTDVLQPVFISIIQERYEPRSILFRNDSRVRELEGLELNQETVGEPVPEMLIVNDDGKQTAIHLLGGQKTGAYLDQRDNRRAARRYAYGRALDAFSYAGGFALQIAEVCDEVEVVDISKPAIELARANVARNGLVNKVRCIEANAFDYLRERDKEGVRYDTIILDPPAFAKNKESLEGALRGYKEINHRAMRLLRSGGILITCSCSHHVSEGLFAEMLADAASDARVWVRVLDRRVQTQDHPILLTVPETLYLKCFILQIDLDK